MKVQILTPEEGAISRLNALSLLASTEFTCFTSTKVQILTPEEGAISRLNALSLLAKY